MTVTQTHTPSRDAWYPIMAFRSLQILVEQVLLYSAMNPDPRVPSFLDFGLLLSG
jgi:hypothetical protein